MNYTHELTVQTKYRAVKMTCGEVMEMYSDLSWKRLYDPKDYGIWDVSKVRVWIEDQRKNKVVWILEQIGIEEKMVWKEKK